MQKLRECIQFESSLFTSAFCILTFALLFALCISDGLVSIRAVGASAQSTYPEPPADRTLIYLADEKNALTALPVEAATTPLRVSEVARSNKRSYLELPGEHSGISISNPLPRFYLFVKDVQNVRPPFIVRLTEKKKARRVEALTQKGLSGFAVPSEEIIRPRLLVLKREDGMLFIQVSPREPLHAGEYAFVGADPARIATFRIVD
jgi:hypothetical protein